MEAFQERVAVRHVVTGKSGDKMHDHRRHTTPAAEVKPLVPRRVEHRLEVSQGLWRRAHRALTELLEAYRYSCDVDRSVWDFAVEIDELQGAGLLRADLRWLVCKGFVEHAREIAPADDTRAFRRGSRLWIAKGSCFVLTAAGVEFVTSMLECAERDRRRRRLHRREQGDGQVEERDSCLILGPVPAWDRDRQELCLGGVVVKQFKVPAANQERVLAAFEEEGWPVRIDDPLPPIGDQDPKARLHDTIVALNRNQKHSLIRFYGDGSGQGVRWGRVVSSQSPPPSVLIDGKGGPKAR